MCMATQHIATFESKTRGPVDVLRGHDDDVVAAIYAHSSDPGITKTLGEKDLNLFAPHRFPDWINKNGGRFLYSAWNNEDLAGIFWLGGEEFPIKHFPNSPLQPPYTAAWRTGYSTPEGGTYEGEGIGKRIALAGIADVVTLTRNNSPNRLSPLADAGIWLDTGIGNIDGQVLYRHLANTSRDQQPKGFKYVGIYEPDFEEGKTALELEPRVGMVADVYAVQQCVKAAGMLLNMQSQS